MDTRVLYPSAALSNILLSTVLLLLLWRHRRAPFVLRWALADLLVLVGAAFAAIAKLVPVWANFLGANVVFLLGGYMLLAGFQLLLGTRRFAAIAIFSVVAGALASGISIFFGVDAVQRLSLVLLFSLPITISAALLCFTGGSTALRLPLRFAGILAFGLTVLSALRAVSTFPGTEEAAGSAPSSTAVILGFALILGHQMMNATYLWLIVAEEARQHAGAQDRLLDQLRGQAEELRAAKAAADAASAAKSAFLATMSHEIRTPLNGVIGFADVLLRTPLDSQQRDYVELQRDAGRGLLTVINGILDFSKLEAGEVTVEPQDIDLTAAMESCCGLFRLAAEERDLVLRLEVDPAMPRWVRLDGYRLRQVISNLLSNAIKFTRTGEIVLTLGAADERLQVAVRDTGLGIAKEKLPELFREFHQLDGSVARDFGGTGLGLAISRRLVALMGGALDVETELGIGSRFFFDLPLALGSAVEPAPPAPIAERKLSILVAEDIEMNQMLIKLLLVEDGHAVTVVDNGASAVDMVARQSFDLVLMDMQMPVMNGVDATRRIRDLPGKAGRLPILALTANVMPEELAACRAAGMQGHLPKPIDPNRLRAAIAEIAAHAVVSN